MSNRLFPHEMPVRKVVRNLSIACAIMTIVVSLAWISVTRFPPGIPIRAMLPVLLSFVVFSIAARLILESLTLRGVHFFRRLAIACIPTTAATAAVVWPIIVRTVFGILIG